MNKQKPTYNRRLILRGLGGAAVAAPFLPSVMEREAKAQGMTTTTPKRLIVFFTHYGCLTTRWFPTKSHGALTAADYTGTPTLAPLAPYASKLLMPRGIRAMNEWSFNGTLGQKNDPHTNPCGSTFTAYPLTPNAPNSGAMNIGKFDAKPTGKSLDHVAASAVNKSGAAPLFLQIGGVSGSASNTQSVISWSDGAGTIFPGYGTPSQVYSSLTNLFGTGTTPNPDTYKVARGKSVIDCVRDDLNRLSGINMSSADKLKLTKWTELLHYVGGTVTPAGSQCTMATATSLGLTGSLTGSDITKTANIMMDLAVLTSLCDANRVIFMKMPAGRVYSNLQYAASDGTMKALSMESHSVSHRIGNAGMGGACVADALSMIHAIDKYYATLFAYLVGRLDSFSEGDVKLLDNTATVWIQEMSDGNSHNVNNMPILQAGSCGGYFKMGQAVNVDTTNTGSATLTRGNSDGDCANGSSTNLDGVGTPSTVANAPINKYFCNLLNAIGAKAGADGFAVAGGTAPVTKFGKYDDTKLFSDGGTAPATHNSPGEFADLRGA